MDMETLYLLLRDQKRELDFLRTRVDVLEHFIKERYPQYFAGEVGTIADPELKPIVINYGAPQ